MVLHILPRQRCENNLLIRHILKGGGFGSPMTPGYAHVSWETMVKAVELLEQPVLPDQNVFSLYSGKIPADSLEAQKAV